MPTNLHGPGDCYHPEHSHVLPALIRRSGSFCMWTTWVRPACLHWSTGSLGPRSCSSGEVRLS
jgi:GDP-L-fucose synthase